MSKQTKQRGPTVSYWPKDGSWHITEPYEPSDSDRAMFPNSYPADDPGPFFVWAAGSFDTELEARRAIRHSDHAKI